MSKWKLFYINRVDDIFLLFSRLSIMFSYCIFLTGFPDSFKRKFEVQDLFCSKGTCVQVLTWCVSYCLMDIFALSWVRKGVGIMPEFAW